MLKKSIICSILVIGCVAVGLKVYAALLHPKVFYAKLENCTPSVSKNYFGHKYVIEGMQDGKCIVREEGDLSVVCELSSQNVRDLVDASKINDKTLVNATFPNGMTVKDQTPTFAVWNYFLSDTDICRLNENRH